MPIAHDFSRKPRTEDVHVEEVVEFSSMLFRDEILTGLKNNGFVKPSPIQLKALSLARCGFDLIIQAKSGTGKTLVFTLTALEAVKVSVKKVQVIILTPTREIAVQVAEVITAVGQGIKGLKVGTFIGGIPINQDIKTLSCCHMAVGAPGRMKQLVELGHLKPDHVRLFVLDEADQLMSQNFQTDINFIYWSLPELKQVIACSATYPEELVNFLGTYMRDGQLVTPSSGSTPVLLGVRQYLFSTPRHADPTHRLISKERALLTILKSVNFNQCVIFSNYISRAESLCTKLRSEGWSGAVWMGGCQKQETRLEAIRQFKNHEARVLVSTDLTSRGLDYEAVDLVINMEQPQDPRTYLHRIGRAGRYGSFGIAISLISEGEELAQFRQMLGSISREGLSVSKISRSDLFGLWTTPVDSYEQIYGTVAKDVTSSCSPLDTSDEEKNSPPDSDSDEPNNGPSNLSNVNSQIEPTFSTPQQMDWITNSVNDHFNSNTDPAIQSFSSLADSLSNFNPVQVSSSPDKCTPRPRLTPNDELRCRNIILQKYTGDTSESTPRQDDPVNFSQLAKSFDDFPSKIPPEEKPSDELFKYCSFNPSSNLNTSVIGHASSSSSSCLNLANEHQATYPPIASDNSPQSNKPFNPQAHHIPLLLSSSSSESSDSGEFHLNSQTPATFTNTQRRYKRHHHRHQDQSQSSSYKSPIFQPIPNSFEHLDRWYSLWGQLHSQINHYVSMCRYFRHQHE